MGFLTSECDSFWKLDLINGLSFEEKQCNKGSIVHAAVPRV